MSDLLERITVKPVNTGDHDKFAHYARKADIELAIFDGLEITALCGKKWRPEGDFMKHPVCPTCKEIWETLE